MAYDGLAILDKDGATHQIAYKDDTDPRVQAVALDVDGGPASASNPVPIDIVSGTATISGSVSAGVPAGATRKRKQVRVTATTTSTDVWTPDSAKRIAVTSLLVTWKVTNACRVSIWQGANADTTYGGTEPTIFDKDFAAGESGGAFLAFPDGNPWETDVANDELHLTVTDTATVSISAAGYELT
jgi:hypothetical protein